MTFSPFKQGVMRQRQQHGSKGRTGSREKPFRTFKGGFPIWTCPSRFVLVCPLVGTDMTGRPGHRTMEMIGVNSAPYLARTPCVLLGVLYFVLIGVETEGLLGYQGRAGIISTVRWNFRPVIFGVDKIRVLLILLLCFFWLLPALWCFLCPLPSPPLLLLSCPCPLLVMEPSPRKIVSDKTTTRRIQMLQML